MSFEDSRTPSEEISSEILSVHNLDQLAEKLTLEWGGEAVVKDVERNGVSTLFYTTPYRRRAKVLQGKLSDSFTVSVTERAAEEGHTVYDIEVTEK